MDEPVVSSRGSQNRSNGSGYRSSDKVTAVRLNRAELRRVRAAARREGYPISDFMAVAAVRAALATDPPPGDESVTLLAAMRALALRAARLSERVENDPETAVEAEALVEQSLDLCAMAYRAEDRSREMPDSAAGASAA